MVTFAGAAKSSGQDAEEAALDYAERVTRAPRDRIAVLRVAEEELRPGVEQRVDVATGRVVAADDAGSP